MKKFLFFTALLLAVISCEKESSQPNSIDAYSMMETAFEGYPAKSEIQPIMQSVLNKYNLEESEENLQKVGSVLVSLRKQSVLGVTELEILKHIYQHGSSSISFPGQAAISATILEKTK